MAISTVNVDFSAILQNAAQATGLLRVRLSQVGTVEDSETGDKIILPIAWQEATLTDGAATLSLVPNKIIDPSCTYYEIQLKSVPDCPKACAKLLLSGIMYVPDEDCNVLDLLISPPSPETANTASGYASQAKQAAQVAENFAIQAGDRYDDVAEAAATALTDIGTAKQDALDAIGTAQSGATEAISTAEDAALQAIGQARGTALDDIGTAQGTAIGAMQAEGNTQVGRVYDAGEDSVADVTAAQATAVSAVQAQQATSVAAVSAEGTAQVNAVTQAGNAYVSTMQGLVSDAQAARDAAQTAQGLAEDAQEAAESASTDAQGYAGDASTSAGQAVQSASDAAGSATAAQASAESIAASAEQIQTNERNITNIQALLNGTLYREETDSTAAYSKTVPAGALPYASINEIGGRTVVWNQLNRNNGVTTTNNGVTLTKNADNVSWVVNGTATGRGSVNIYNYAPIITGHKYLVKGCPKNDGSCFLGFAGFNIDSGNGGIWTAISISVYYFRFDFFTGAAFDNVTITPIFIDLTQMFGSGNEPSSVSEFEAMFPSIDPAYNAGELRSAGVTEAVSEGRNILNPAYRDGAIKGNCSMSVGTEGEIVAANVSNIFAVPCDLHSDYILSMPNNGELLYVCLGNELPAVGTTAYKVGNMTNRAFISFNTMGYQYILIGYNDNKYDAVAQCWLERGSTAMEYTPYRSPITLPIPSAIQSLPGYGWSTLDKYNSVDFVTKKFTENCRRVRAEGDLIVLYWNGNKATQLDTNKSITFIIYVAGEGYPATLGESSNYINNKGLTVQAVSTGLGDKIGYFAAAGSIYVCLSLATLGMSSITSADSNETILAALKTALETYGLEFVYNLATPIETDISQYLTDDNLLQVEPGGSLTFKNQNGNDWRVPVPNEETYLVQATPELPTTDGTYTLQCTVTGGTPSVTWVTA